MSNRLSAEQIKKIRAVDVNWLTQAEVGALFGHIDFQDTRLNDLSAVVAERAIAAHRAMDVPPSGFDDSFARGWNQAIQHVRTALGHD